MHGILILVIRIHATNFFTRSSHYEEFSKQVMNVLTQWETDLQKTREAEEKLEVMGASKFIDRV